MDPDWALMGTYLVSCLEPWGARMSLPFVQWGNDRLSQTVHHFGAAAEAGAVVWGWRAL